MCLSNNLWYTIVGNLGYIMDYDFSIDSKQILLMIRNAFVLDNSSIIKFGQTEDNEITAYVRLTKMETKEL